MGYFFGGIEMATYYDKTVGKKHIEIMEACATERKRLQETEGKTVSPDFPIEVSVAGVTFGSRQKALERLTYYKPEEILTVLVPEPENPYDENAIAVKVLVDGTDTSYCIGYVPKTETWRIRPFMWKLPELIITEDSDYSAKIRIRPAA